MSPPFVDVNCDVWSSLFRLNDRDRVEVVFIAVRVQNNDEKAYQNAAFENTRNTRR